MSSILMSMVSLHFPPFMVSLHSYPVDILWYIQSIPFDDSCQTS
ncbi:Uncharacterised protein [Salmonella enterica subsp. enterica serovar Daytona]|uniref:Uncharacterized protein n=1 Tax=Salmonella enterica subsp. enterica serovar Daytona TaxID=1962639 RepID=A0A447JIF1_SALET|nr:Uncharacterised protein [Salmonella enterica subsp. enterica serovar Daytona]